ncbi:hypothetical protein QEJ31_07760 [Pigmentibacter sp. JX0631]|uniref:hypothetical protein n=1 Tax=Pigmentibacter sp. JX0631 TaxID=2976982 RepID=UPI002468FE51|nr:hypothetical protein [Pigmentibacter sp. JX0631]WGL61484.1 hypothetical protein QEJ31_07760 [Pigmentibacter sp. JX0631]
MLYSPSIFIKQLKLYAGVKPAYDQKFDYGLNIIRSKDNSTGKSSILNFIYYILGGDIYSWTNAAHEIDYGLMEVELNGDIYTLLRNKNKEEEAVSIFNSPLIEVEKNIDIRFYSTKSIDNFNELYSNYIFEKLNIPNVAINENRNLKFQDLLGLLYSDQDTSVYSIFKNSEKSNEAIRKIISEIFIFSKDTDYLKKLNLLAEAKKEYAKYNNNINVQNDNLSGLKLMHFNEEKLIIANKKEEINKEIFELSNITKIKKNKNLDNEILTIMEIGEIGSNEIDKIQNKIISLREELQLVKQQIREKEIYLKESTAFLEALKDRQNAINTSLIVSKKIENIEYKFCPSCFSNNISNNFEKDCCYLCKNKIDRNVRKYSRNKALQEIEFQEKESKELFSDMQKAKKHLEEKKININKEIKELEKRFKNIYEISDVKSAERDQKLIELGISQSKLKELEYIEGYEKDIQKMIIIKEELKVKMQQIQNDIRQIEDSGLKNEYLRFIENSMRKILKEDAKVDGTFNSISDINVYFDKNRININSSKISASSQVILKNALHLAIFELSLKYPSVLYPRLLLLDNIDDKGMTSSRSQNFQRIMKTLSQKYDVKHQIILTTTQIAEELDNTSCCIGDVYTASNKTLTL